MYQSIRVAVVALAGLNGGLPPAPSDRHAPTTETPIISPHSDQQEVPVLPKSFAIKDAAGWFRVKDGRLVGDLLKTEEQMPALDPKIDRWYLLAVREDALKENLSDATVRERNDLKRQCQRTLDIARGCMREGITNVGFILVIDGDKNDARKILERVKPRVGIVIPDCTFEGPALLFASLNRLESLLPPASDLLSAWSCFSNLTPLKDLEEPDFKSIQTERNLNPGLFANVPQDLLLSLEGLRDVNTDLFEFALSRLPEELQLLARDGREEELAEVLLTIYGPNPPFIIGSLSRRLKGEGDFAQQMSPAELVVSTQGKFKNQESGLRFDAVREKIDCLHNSGREGANGQITDLVELAEFIHDCLEDTSVNGKHSSEALLGAVKGLRVLYQLWYRGYPEPEPSEGFTLEEGALQIEQTKQEIIIYLQDHLGPNGREEDPFIRKHGEFLFSYPQTP